MLSSSARRAALTAPSIPVVHPLAHLAPRATVTSKPVKQQSHQRRFSSSKPSSPPADGPKGVAEAVPPTQTRPESEKKARAGRKKAAKEDGGNVGNSKAKQVEPAHNLPSVPSTQHISPTHISASDFFSLYRPISLTTSFPKPISASAFASIFEPRVRSNIKSADVISTLTSTLDRFDALSGNAKRTTPQTQQWNEETDNVRAAITAESFRKADVKHLDGVTVEDSILPFPAHILSTFRPFNPPPAPVPQDPITANALATGREAAASLEVEPEPQHRTYTAVLTVEESTHANGEVTYSAHSTPLMEQEEPSRTPRRYIERVRRRIEEGEGMWAISVKRQRKLKMKKHKYKKLMKRTRVLRRKLDRT